MSWIVLLVAAYALTALCAVPFHRAHRAFLRALVVPRPPEEEFTLHEVAHLRAGARRVVHVALAAMVLGGRLKAKDKVLTVTDPVPRDEVEAGLIKVIGLAPRRRMWRRMDRLYRIRAVAAVGDRLGDQGLVRHPTRLRTVHRAHRLLIGAVFLSVATGLTAVGLAAPGGRIVSIPIAATTVLLVAGVKSATPDRDYFWSFRTTEAGQAALTAHETRHPRWIPPTHDELSQEDALLLSGVLTQGALYGKLAPLSGAITWPESPRSEAPFEDPPGLGGL